MPTLLSPFIWYAGAAVVAAPIAIHLLNRMRVKIVHWGAMKFLLESIRKNERRLRIEDLLLLLLRCAMILLLAYAFGRPVLNPEGAGEASKEGPAIAFLIIDQTASMGQSNGVSTRYEMAKSAAGKILDGLPASSQAALFLVSNHLNKAMPSPTSNLAVVRKIIDSSEPGYATADLYEAIQEALSQLKTYTGRKEVDIFTDNQAIAWKQIDQVKADVAAASEVNVRLIPLGGAGEDNLAVTAIKPQASVPAAGQPYEVMVEVSNFGNAPVSGVQVQVGVDDEPSSNQAVIDGEIPPGQARGVNLNVNFPQAGYHTITASIPPDRLPADNQRSIAVQVIDQMHVAIVEGTAPRKASRDGFFLYNALAPVAKANAGSYFLKPEYMPASWLDDGDYSKEEMIFLSNVAGITAPAAEKLKKFVNDGGALIIFPGPNSRPDDFNTPLKDLLPATLGAIKDISKKPAPGNLMSWQVSKYPHYITSLWNDSNYTSLGSVRTWAWFPLTPVETKDKTDAPLPIVNYQDGTPAAMERPIGHGHVILFSSTGDTRGSYFALHPDFIPVMSRIVGFVSRHESPEKLALSPGAAFEHPVNIDMVGKEFSVIRPDSKSKPVIGGKVELVNREATVRYLDTGVAGAYRVVVNGSDLPVAAFSVQMDAAESNLKTTPDDALAFLDKGNGNVVSTASTALQPPGGIRREFWGLLVVMAAIVAVVEMLLAHKFSLAK